MEFFVLLSHGIIDLWIIHHLFLLLTQISPILLYFFYWFSSSSMNFIFNLSFFASTMSVESPSSSNGVHTHVSTINKRYQNDTLNLYFMHPNENPALVLVIPLLNVWNYHFWLRYMTMALRSKTTGRRSRFDCLRSLQHHDHVMTQ